MAKTTKIKEEAKAKPKKTKADEFVASLIREGVLDMDDILWDVYPDELICFEDSPEPIVEKGIKLPEAELFNALQNNKIVQAAIKKVLKNITHAIAQSASNEMSYIEENREEEERALEEEREELEAERQELEEEAKDLRKEAAQNAILKDPALSKKDKAKAKKAFQAKNYYLDGWY